jgi:hypothetical protein
METPATKFEGYAIVELFGHAKEIGYVTTQYFGAACLFQIDVPELLDREFTLQAPQWLEHEGRTVLAPEGSKVKRAASPGRTRLVGCGAIYSITPCTEETAMVAIERMQPRPLMILELAKKEAPAVTWPQTDEDEDISSSYSADLASISGLNANSLV